MKNKQTGITAKLPRHAPNPPPQPPSKKNNLLFFLSAAGLLGLIAFVTYLLWPMPNQGAGSRPLKLNPNVPPGPAPEGMVWVPGGEFVMGDEILMPNGEIADESLPLHEVYVDGFWMDKHEVTNEKWARFAKETGYLTIAEKKPDPRDLPFASAEELKHPCSICFMRPQQPVEDPFRVRPEHNWWTARKGASWKQPEGEGSTIAGKDNYPVVHIAHVDALEYCRWLSKKTGRSCRLPTEAEWEFAARGGLDRNKYTWGNELNPGGKWMANIWQGKFPNEDSALDGFAGLAPVGSFPANGYGLYDMSGNAWEWCLDYYQEDYYHFSPRKNPRGPAIGIDPNEPGVATRVRRGGSFLCSDNYCIRYLVGARDKSEEKSAANHTGFRCICEAQ
jgi:sulfatase modifying factor 1